MTTEEMAAFVNRALANPNNWMVHSTALLLRSRIEKEKFRTAGTKLCVALESHTIDVTFFFFLI